MSDTEFSEVIQAVKLFTDYDRPWAVCGGWAIDLFLRHVTRPHKDLDFAVLRKDQLVIQKHLLSHGWTLEKVVSGQLVPWQSDEWLSLPVHIVWCRNPEASPDFIELLFNEIDETNFLYRRDTSVTLPVEKMIISSASGIRILAPEIVLLYKSLKPEDPSAAMDFRNILPKLSTEKCAWLARSLRKLYRDHVWLENLRSAKKGRL
jgi:hypothetical protein